MLKPYVRIARRPWSEIEPGMKQRASYNNKNALV
jgi:hypothetical protein